jgi:hypothetical protein
VPAKLVVSSNKKKQLVVQLESAAGKTLLTAGPFTDKRSVAGLRRTLKSVLADSVGYEDQTAKVAEKPAATAAVKPATVKPATVKPATVKPTAKVKVAAAAKPVNAVEAPIVAATAPKTRRPRKTAAK